MRDVCKKILESIYVLKTPLKLSPLPLCCISHSRNIISDLIYCFVLKAIMACFVPTRHIQIEFKSSSEPLHCLILSSLEKSNLQLFPTSCVGLLPDGQLKFKKKFLPANVFRYTGSFLTYPMWILRCTLYPKLKNLPFLRPAKNREKLDQNGEWLIQKIIIEIAFKNSKIFSNR